MFGNKKMKRLEGENESLSKDCEYKTERIKALEQELRTIAVKNQEIFDIVKADNAVEVSALKAKIIVLEKNFDKKVEAAISSHKSSQDKAHDARMSRLEKDFADKIARCDRALEQDKASYRKYYRTEHNKGVDFLTAENTNLVVANATLTGKNEGLTQANTLMQGQVVSAMKLVETAQVAQQNLAKGVVDALPTIEAMFTTPEVPSNNVTVGSGNKS